MHMQKGLKVKKGDVVSAGQTIGKVGSTGHSTGNHLHLQIEQNGKPIDPEKYMIVMDHQPTDYDNEAAVKADLVLSGHTHGGQVFPVTYVGEWFDINDNTYGFERRGGTDFIVTSGISDWEILFKTATKSEYVIINID